MLRTRTLLVLGIWMALLPYLGFPYSWQDIFVMLTGFIILYLSYLSYQESKKKYENQTFDNFRENRFFEQSELEIQDEEAISNQ